MAPVIPRFVWSPASEAHAQREQPHFPIMNSNRTLIPLAAAAGLASSAFAAQQCTYTTPSASTDSCWIDFVENPSVFVGQVANGNEKDIVAADLDNDGDLDVVSVEKENFYATGNRSHTVWWNDGGSLVNVSFLNFGSQRASRDVAVLDADGDGFLDIVVANTEGDTASGTSAPAPVGLWINQTQVAGQFAGFVESTGWLTLPMNCGAVNCPSGDCSPDLWACAIATGDLNGDSYDDIWVTTYGPGTIAAASPTGDRIYLNDPQSPGSFQDISWEALGCDVVAPGANQGGATSAAVSDFDGDGLLDLMRGGPFQRIEIFYNNGNGAGGVPTFSGQPGIFPGGGIGYMQATADLDGDGDLDMLIVDDLCDSILLNPEPAGDARDKTQWTRQVLDDPLVHNKSMNFGSNVFVADLDGDGFVDVGLGDIDTSQGSTIGNAGTSAHIMRNRTQTPGVFGGIEDQDAFEFLPYNITDSDVWDGAFLDLNGDGLLDLIYATDDGFRYFERLPDALNYGPTSANSVGSGAQMGFSGLPSESVNTLTLTASGAPANTLGQFFYGDQTANVPALDGTRLVGGTIGRLAAINANGAGEFSQAVDLTAGAFSAYVPCDTLYFQLFYRDAGFGAFGANYSDGLEVTIWR